MQDRKFTQDLKEILNIAPDIHGEACLNLLLKNLSNVFKFSHVLFAKAIPDKPQIMKTEVFITDQNFSHNIEYELKGSPCEQVAILKSLCVYPNDVKTKFPEDLFLTDENIEFYCGTPIVDQHNKLVGIFAILHTEEMDNYEQIEIIMQVIGSRISSELYKEAKDIELRKINSELVAKNNQLLHLEFLSQTGYWELDLETEETTWSDEVYKIYQLPVGTPTDKIYALSYYDPHDRPRLIKHLEDCVKENKNFIDIFKFIDENGTNKWVNVHGNLVILDNKPIKIVGAMQDVTEKFQLFNEHVRLKNNLSGFQETIDQFLIVAKTDLKGNIIYANDRFCERSGYSREELIGQNHSILSSGRHSFDFFRELWQTILKGESWQGIICNRAKNGDEYWVHSFLFPLLDEQGNIFEFAAFRIDITGKMQLEKELHDQKEKLSFASQLATVGEMSAGIAHEIANPLTIISGCAVMLGKDDLPLERKKKAVVNLNKSVSRIGKIVKGLHDLSRRSKDNSFDLNNLADILTSTLDFCDEALKKNHIELIVEKPNHDIFLHCSDIKISQILLNLINNARDAIIDSKAEERWIKIVFQETPEQISIIVIDSGPGIPDSIRTRILESFFTTKQPGKGTGLGLSLVSRFTKEHGGKVMIDQIDGRNAFQIIFPKEAIDIAI